MRPIDADALIAKIKKEGLLQVSCGWSDSEIESEVIDMLEDAPTIDAAPVVHGRREYPLGLAWNYICSECGVKMNKEA